MNAYEILKEARSSSKPTAKDIIENIFDDFFLCSGDRLSDDDKAIIGGIGKIGQQVVTVIGINRDKTTEAKMYRYGMPMPSGYRKAIRLMKQAEKFNRPILTLIDTPGAFPGVNAENSTQAIAIAESIATMSQIKVPSIGIIIGEGGSGGALALGMVDKLFMLENSIYSVISPEACATILWKDKSKVEIAAEALRFTANDLFDFGICDGIIEEKNNEFYRYLSNFIETNIKILLKDDVNTLLKERYRKYRRIGSDVVI